jgi:hypothetical protein
MRRDIPISGILIISIVTGAYKFYKSLKRGKLDLDECVNLDVTEKGCPCVDSAKFWNSFYKKYCYVDTGCGISKGYAFDATAGKFGKYYGIVGGQKIKFKIGIKNGRRQWIICKK